MAEQYKPGDVLEMPQRGRRAEPLDQDMVDAVTQALEKINAGQGVATGRFFDKEHQAVAFGARLKEAIAERDPRLRDRIAASALEDHREDDGTKVGPFHLAIRKK